MTPAVRAGLLAIAGVIVLLGLSLFGAPRETDRLFAWTIANPAHGRLPGRELPGLDDARHRVRGRARMGARARLRRAVPDRRRRAARRDASSTWTSSTWTT